MAQKKSKQLSIVDRQMVIDGILTARGRLVVRGTVKGHLEGEEVVRFLRGLDRTFKGALGVADGHALVMVICEFGNHEPGVLRVLSFESRGGASVESRTLARLECVVRGRLARFMPFRMSRASLLPRAWQMTQHCLPCCSMKPKSPWCPVLPLAHPVTSGSHSPLASTP